MAKALDKEMYNYFMQLNEAEKKSVIQMLKTFLKGREEKTGHVSIAQYNKEVDDAVSRVEEGDFYTNEEVEKMSKNW